MYLISNKNVTIVMSKACPIDK